MMKPDKSAPLKSGQRPVQQTTKAFKAGEVVFEEGSKGREIFIVQEGTFAVYKNSPSGEVLLAQIEKGGVIGEMSLLDNLPRSATVKAVVPSTLLVINPLTFFIALKTVPVWLASIINIIISRLRDANKRVDQALLLDPEQGLIALVLLLLPGNRHSLSTTTALDYELVVNEAHQVCRLKKEVIKKIIAGLEKRKIIAVELDQSYKKHCAIPDPEILRLYGEYLKLKSRKKSFPEKDVSDEAYAFLSQVVSLAHAMSASTVGLLKSELVKSMEQSTPGQIEARLAELNRLGLVATTSLGAGDTTLSFDPQAPRRIRIIKECLPRFEMKVV
jgi:CRP/FNR family cyclic AMP-dependent transcriptional regulator